MVYEKKVEETIVKCATLFQDIAKDPAGYSDSSVFALGHAERTQLATLLMKLREYKE